MNNLNPQKMKRSRGFTLAETVLAIAVVGLLMTTFMAVLLPARKSIQGSLSLQEADRVSSALSTELGTLRASERQRYKTAFDKAFNWMRRTGEARNSILIYNYRGDLSKPPREDGSLKPFTGKASIPGSNSMVSTSVILSELDRTRLEEDYKAIVGPVFVVRMTQFVWNKSATNEKTQTDSQRYGGRGGKYVLANQPASISNPYREGQQIATPDTFMYNPANKDETPWGAEVLYMAEFFQMPTVQPQALKTLSYEKMRKPVFTRNLSFRR